MSQWLSSTSGAAKKRAKKRKADELSKITGSIEKYVALNKPGNVGFIADKTDDGEAVGSISSETVTKESRVGNVSHSELTSVSDEVINKSDGSGESDNDLCTVTSVLDKEQQRKSINKTNAVNADKSRTCVEDDDGINSEVKSVSFTSESEGSSYSTLCSKTVNFR